MCVLVAELSRAKKKRRKKMFPSLVYRFGKSLNYL